MASDSVFGMLLSILEHAVSRRRMIMLDPRSRERKNEMKVFVSFGIVSL